jgi:hypothetical protein
LRTCQTAPFPQQDWHHLFTQTKDLEMLLMPAEWSPEITAALLMGGGFTLLRQNKHLTTQEAACVLNRDEQIILEMEYGRWGKQATRLATTGSTPLCSAAPSLRWLGQHSLQEIWDALNQTDWMS